MSQSIRLRSRPIVDPRGVSRVAPVSLAPRPAPRAGARILLFDNSKLDPAYGPYHAIAETIAAELGPRIGEVRFEELALDLMRVDRPGLARVARELAGRELAGVVIGLCDSGVTQPSILLAAELERSGVPTVAICMDVALGLAAANAQAVVPGLPLPAITAIRTATREEVARQTRAILDEVADGLTRPPAELLRRFRERHGGAGAGLEAADGELRLCEDIAAEATRDAEGRLVVDLDPGAFAEAIYERLTSAVMTDGFPVVPPTRDRVDLMLEHGDRDRREVLVEQLPPSGAAVTVETLAAAAVMAGCRPEYFPIVLTAFEGMADERYRLFQAVITSHPGGNLVIVSGPLAEELGIASGGGCLGPGHRANATIGRALTLALLNVGRALPGGADMAVFGSPAEYSYCLAEASRHTPWTPLHVELYGPETTTVTVHRCEAPHNAIDHLSTTPEGVLGTLASVAATLGGNNAYRPSELVVFLNPEHARVVADGGWSKRDVQQFFFEHARNPAAELEGRGITPLRPAWVATADRVPVVRDPSEVLVIVAGLGGPQSMVAIPWGFARAVTRPVAFKDGRPIRSVADIRRIR